MRKRSSSKRHSGSVSANAGRTGEACRTRGHRATKTTHPSESGTVQSEAGRFRESQLYIALDFWPLPFFTPHMHTFTVQGCSVWNQRLCSPAQRRVHLGGDRTQVTTNQALLQSVVSHCRFLQMWEVFDGLSVTRKSHLNIKYKIKQKQKKTTQNKAKGRDGKRSAMYRLNCPVKTQTTAV